MLLVAYIHVYKCNQWLKALNCPESTSNQRSSLHPAGMSKSHSAGSCTHMYIHVYSKCERLLYFHRPPSQDCSKEKEDKARWARAVARREVLSQLQQLECQLTAIESTARTVEGELLASNQVEGVAGRMTGSHAGGIMLWVHIEHSIAKISAVHCRHIHNMYMYGVSTCSEWIAEIQILYKH